MYGVPYNCQGCKPGQKHLLSHGDLKFIVVFLTYRHCLYLDKIQNHLQKKQGTFVSISILFCALHHLHYSPKGVSACALERDVLLRSAFMNKIADEVTNPVMRKLQKYARNRTKSDQKRTESGPEAWPTPQPLKIGDLRTDQPEFHHFPVLYCILSFSSGHFTVSIPFWQFLYLTTDLRWSLLVYSSCNHILEQQRKFPPLSLVSQSQRAQCSSSPLSWRRHTHVRP